MRLEYNVHHVHRDFNTNGYFFDYTDGKRMFVSRATYEDAQLEILTVNENHIGVFLRHRADQNKFGRTWYRLYNSESERLGACQT